jgi:NadR type nicotinamide-nucleotide adenylyltransferase
MEKDFGQSPCNCKKVVLFGPESTGKTTLAKQLASHFNSDWVPEYARAFLQNKWDKTNEICSKEDLLIIAAGQMALENQKASNTNSILFCDTDLLVTKIYSEVYFNGYCDPDLHHFAVNNHYDLYLLLDIDIPWVADDLRDKPEERDQMLIQFKKARQSLNRPYVLIQGQGEDRFQCAIQAIQSQFAHV